MAGTTTKGLRYPTGTDLKSPDAIKNLANDVDAKLPLNDTGWIDMQLLNGWVHFDSGLAYPGGGGRSCQYRRLGGIVQLRGLARSGTVGQVFTNMPPGFRWLTMTTDDWYQPCASYGAFGAIGGQYNTWNLIVLAGNNGWVGLERVQWYVDPSAGMP